MTTHETVQAMLDRAEQKHQLLTLDEAKWLCRLALAQEKLIEETRRCAEVAFEHWDNDRDAKAGKMLAALNYRMSNYDNALTAAFEEYQAARDPA